MNQLKEKLKLNFRNAKRTGQKIHLANIKSNLYYYKVIYLKLSNHPFQGIKGVLSSWIVCTAIFIPLSNTGINLLNDTFI